MKIIYTLLLSTIFLAAMSQPNCNVYKEDESCYQACLESRKAIQNPQGSKASQEHFDRAIRYCPTFDYAHFEKAVPYLKNGRFLEWKGMIDKAVELNPEAYLSYRASCVYQFFRDYRSVIIDLERLESLINYDIGHSQNGEYHMNMIKALCYRGLGQKQKAIETIETQLKKQDHLLGNYDYLHLGVLYLEEDNMTTAIRYLEMQVEHNSYIAEGYYFLGKAYLRQDDKEKAKANFELAKTKYLQGYHRIDPYVEPMDTVTLEEIEEALQQL